MATPKRALAALATAPLKVAGVVLRPLTLGHAIVLEKIGCPLLGAKADAAKLRVLDLLPTAYVLATDPQEALGKLAEGRPVFDAAVTAFASGISASDGLRLARAVLSLFAAVDGVSPQGGPEGNGREATGGSQPSPQPPR